MNLSPLLFADLVRRIDPVWKPNATARVDSTTLLGAGGLATGAAAAAAQALLPGEPSGAIELSPLGRIVATLVAFGLPVVDLTPEGAAAAAAATAAAAGALPEGAAPPSADHVAAALAAALSLQPPLDEQAWTGAAPPAAAPQEPRTTRRAEELPPERARSARQDSAGAALNAVLCAALTGQTALQVRRWDRKPLLLELQREPDGHGGFRIARVRIRHEAEGHVLEAVVDLGLHASPDAPPLHVEINCSPGLSEAVGQGLAGLREALAARGLAATVRTFTLLQAAPGD